MLTFLSNISIKDLLLVLTSLSSLFFGMWQFFLRRKYERKDRIAEKKFEAYKNFLEKLDFLNNNLRIDLSTKLQELFLNFSNDILKCQSEEEKNKMLTTFNSKVYDFSKQAIAPYYTLKNESFAIRLLCSNELNDLLEKYLTISKSLLDDYQDMLTRLFIGGQNLGNLIPGKIDADERITSSEILFKKIVTLMRDEIGFVK